MNTYINLNMFKTFNQICVQEPEISEAKTKDESILSIIQRHYILLGYYSGVIPYKPVFDPEKRCWNLKNGKYQKYISWIWWIIIWFFIITEYLGYFLEILQATKSLTPKSYFTLVNNMVSCWVMILFFQILRNDRHKLEICINHSFDLLHINKYLVKWSRGYVCFNYICLFCFTMVFLPFYSDFFVGELKSPVQTFQEYYIKNGRRRFFIQKNCTEYTATDVVVGAVEFVGISCWCQVYWLYTALLAVTLPVTVWLAVKNFEMFSKDLSRMNIIEVKEKYETLKRFCGHINNVWSTVTVVWILDSVIRVVMILNELVSSRSLFNLLGGMVWIGNVTMLFILSGETFRKMDNFKARLLDETNFEVFYQQDKLVLKRLLRDLDGAPVGIGATGMYKLNYGFVAQLMIGATTIFLVSFEKE